LQCPETEWKSIEQRVPITWPECHRGGRVGWEPSLRPAQNRLQGRWGAPGIPHPSSRRTPFTFLNNGLASSPALAALSAHSAFSFCPHAETNTSDYDPDSRRRAFLDDPAPFRARFLNDVVVRKGGRNRQNCQSGTGQNCSQDKSFLDGVRHRRRAHLQENEALFALPSHSVIEHTATPIAVNQK
jgi:hypothetical protein